MYDVIQRRGRARLVIFLLLALALVVDPVSHNHLVGAISRTVSADDGSSSIQHPICPVCAADGNIAVLHQVITATFVTLSHCAVPEIALAELCGEIPSDASRAPPASLI